MVTPLLSMNTFVHIEISNVGFGFVAAARDFNLVLPLQVEAPDGIHEIHQPVGQGRAKSVSGGRLCGRGKNQAEGFGLLWARASIHRLPREFGWVRARIHGSQIYFFFCPCLD